MLVRKPEFGNRNTLKYAKEEIEDAEDAYGTHKDLQAPDVPAFDGDAEEEGGDGKLEQSGRHDVCKLAKVPELGVIVSKVLMPLRGNTEAVPSSRSGYSPASNLRDGVPFHSVNRKVQRLNRRYIPPRYLLGADLNLERAHDVATYQSRDHQPVIIAEGLHYQRPRKASQYDHEAGDRIQGDNRRPQLMW